MVKIFEKYYGAKIDTYNSSDIGSIARSVTASVVSTVSARSAGSVSSSILRGKTLRTFSLDKTEPAWESLPVVEAKVLAYDLPTSIDDITDFCKFENVVKKVKLQIAPHPFDKGSVRLAYYGRLLHQEGSRRESEDLVVFKEFQHVPAIEDLDRQRYMADLEVQTIAAKIAFEFNAGLGTNTTSHDTMKVKFLMAKVVRIELDEFRVRFMSYEKRFRGVRPVMKKFTNNLNFVMDEAALPDEEDKRALRLAIAYSHFSYHITDGYLLVCDLQGIRTVDTKGKPTLLLTDPAIHCSKHLRFGKTNLHGDGFKGFFKQHRCNGYCRQLGLTMPNVEEL